MNSNDKPEKDENYSRDADQTRLILIIGRVALTFLIGVFALELIAMVAFYWKFVAGSNLSTFEYKPFIFTSEITHALIPVTVGAVSGVAAFLFGKEVGKRQQAEETNGKNQTNGRNH